MKGQSFSLLNVFCTLHFDGKVLHGLVLVKHISKSWKNNAYEECSLVTLGK